MKINWDKVFNQYQNYWNRENQNRPLVYMVAPRDNYTADVFEKAHATLKDRWLDTEYQLKKHREYINSVEFLGEGYPLFCPNLGPDFMGAVCGCELEFSETTSWAEPCIENYENFAPIKFDENNFWWKKICEITNAALNDAKGDYLVGITDIHAGADCLVSLRGPQESAFDIYDEPESFKRIVWEAFPVYKEIVTYLNNMISAKQQASSNWMGIIHPTELWYPTSCDFSCMISGDNFDEFIMPELIAEIDWLPNSIYHLDGVDALRHLDTLLKIEKLKGIQWVYGAGQPSAKHWIDVLKKIQQAGKCIQIACECDDLIPLCEAINPEGVHFTCYPPDKASGEYLLKEMERVCKQKRAQFSF